MYKQNVNKFLAKTLLQFTESYSRVSVFVFKSHWETFDVITLQQLQAQTQQ